MLTKKLSAYEAIKKRYLQFLQAGKKAAVVFQNFVRNINTETCTIGTSDRYRVLQQHSGISVIYEFLPWHISGVARCNLTFPLASLSFITITVLRMFWRTTIICVVYSALKKLIWQTNGINSWTFSFFTTFDVDYHDKSALMTFKYLFGDKAPSYSTVKN